ncbi:hypothetical protein MJO28_005422 [Puccinia striiformis f. sp. tritici]|uniref:Uncharacterized protein n=1 Tax=Puccinia striiformis f. sp. tritici TaxID=168172 RepID=A0ACC0EK10_9BASI|nr:hypothetical protein MJO28_005422 [Puccinia striiformis f. sp. tritici]
MTILLAFVSKTTEVIILIRHYKDEHEEELGKDEEERGDVNENLRKSHEEIGYDKVFDGISMPSR